MNIRALVAVALAGHVLLAISYAHACTRIDQLARSSEVSTKVSGPGQTTIDMPTARAKMVASVFEKLIRIAIPTDSPLLLICSSPSIIAAAVPRGSLKLVLLSTAIVEQIIQEDEHVAAGILGHEIGHFVLQHHERKKQAINIAQEVAADVGVRTAVATRDARAALDAAVRSGSELFYSYSREFEMEADYYGLDLMDRAGFDPEGFTRVTLSMRKLTGDGPGTTHPQWSARLARLEEIIEDRSERRNISIKAQAMNEVSQPYLMRARVLHKAGQWNALRAHVDGWLSHLPEASLGWYYRALVLHRNGTTQAGLHALEKAVVLDPHADEAWRELCVRSYRAGFVKESAYCSTHLSTVDSAHAYRAATEERVIAAGVEPRVPRKLWITKNSAQSTLISNDLALLHSSGQSYERLPPVWAPRP